ncbi:uncharacterized protein LOC126898854 [Daktulosphaira vitifoliae]|uniref:uncharacterized protein LOC126898854 n=1 Tax=Daktulosphaira vitifoliae TaxID=58002 RepID=UPI0021AACC9A|nr:uncharacterized protein LOC126898854 [Daktulosphaira vitifoliae]
MFNNQLFIKYEIKSINEKLDILLQNFERLENLKVLATTENSSTTDYSAMDCIFPIELETDLESVNVQILSDSTYQKKLIKEFSLLGGGNVRKILKRIMTKLFSDKVLQHYSYVSRGLKGKTNFSQLLICKVVFDSIVKIPKYENCLQEVEDKIKIYLTRAAPFRLKRSHKKN